MRGRDLGPPSESRKHKLPLIASAEPATYAARKENPMTMSLMLAALFAVGEPMTAEVMTDAITDRVSATATLRSGDYRLEVGCTPHEARRVWVRLASNRWFRIGDPLDQGLFFTHRFDDHRPQRLKWRVHERRATLVGRNRVEPFVRWLTVSDRLTIRARGPEGRRYDVDFEIEGAREAISEALDACNDNFLNGPRPTRWHIRLPRVRLPRL